MASNWRHSICDPCWDALCERNGEPGRPAMKVALAYREHERCCFCGLRHRSGIYLRHDPASDLLVCRGEHP